MNKLRGWTALAAVKIICFMLVPVCFFSIIRCIFMIEDYYGQTRIYTDVIFADIDSNKYFYNRNIPDVEGFAYTAAKYISEELIINGTYLVWVEETSGCRLMSPDREREYAYIGYDIEYVKEGGLPDDIIFEYSDEYGEYGFYDTYGNFMPEYRIREMLEENATLVVNIPEDIEEQKMNAQHTAIVSQVAEFNWAVNKLQSTEGLIYHISNNKGEVPGSAAQNKDWFMTMPVYFISEDSEVISSHANSYYMQNNPWYDYSDMNIYAFEQDDADNAYAYHYPAIYLSYTHESIFTKNSAYKAAAAYYQASFITIGVYAVLSLLFLALLFLGAGRKYKDYHAAPGSNNGEGIAEQSSIISNSDMPEARPMPAGNKTRPVHFNIFDKPFLDITLAFAAAWVILFTLLAIEIYETTDISTNKGLFNIFAAVFTAVIFTPVLCWGMSAVKRMKTGYFLRHTLIYCIPSKIWKTVASKWVGLHSTLRIILIMILLYLAVIAVGIAGYSNADAIVALLPLVIVAFVGFILFTYTARLNKLKKGVLDIAGGNDVRIDAGKGELGIIENAVNNISAGINIAVEERMKSERLKTELITNVSHDIRTPLTSIITYTDLLKTEGLRSKKAPEYLDILIQKADRLKALTDDLFEAAKASTGNIEVNLTDVDIPSLINQVLGEMDNAVKESGLDLRVNMPEKLRVTADGRLMWRVFENLFSNALRYSMPASRIYVDAAADDGAAQGAVKYARIDIKNVSSQELNFDPSELTERFKRGDSSRADGGSGLGLSIAQSFVAAQGGNLKISIDGDLFKVSVYLPCV